MRRAGKTIPPGWAPCSYAESKSPMEHLPARPPKNLATRHLDDSGKARPDGSFFYSIEFYPIESADSAPYSKTVAIFRLFSKMGLTDVEARSR